MHTYTYIHAYIICNCPFHHHIHTHTHTHTYTKRTSAQHAAHLPFSNLLKWITSINVLYTALSDRCVALTRIGIALYMPVTCTLSPGLHTSTRSSNAHRLTVCGVSPSGMSPGDSCVCVGMYMYVYVCMHLCVYVEVGCWWCLAFGHDSCLCVYMYMYARVHKI